MIKRIILFIAIVLIAHAHSKAQNVDSAFLERNVLWQNYSVEAQQNPAIKGLQYKYNNTEVFYWFNNKWINRPFVLEEGRGFNAHSINASTYLKMQNNSVVWGEASYLNAKNKGIKWNSISDYYMLSPYIMADSVGGNTQTERYWFKGGYSKQLKTITLGGELTFRAQQEYRINDPRMRAVVLDLKANVGAVKSIFNYNIAANAFLNIYKQTHSVDFYNETKAVSEYLLTGIGSYNYRFSSRVTSGLYQGLGYGVGLNLHSKKSKGFYLDFNFSNITFQRTAVNLNSLPLSKLYSNNFVVALGYKYSGNWIFDVSGKLNIEGKTGNESIIGNEAKGDYPILDWQTMYNSAITNYSVSFLLGQHKKVSHYTRLITSLSSMNNNNVYPERKQTNTRIAGNISNEIIFSLNKKINIKTLVSVLYSHNIKNTINIPRANMSGSFVNYVMYNNYFYSANYLGLNGDVEGQYSLPHSGYAIFLKCGGGLIKSNKDNNGRLFSISCGLRL